MKNRAKCKLCNTIIESLTREDLVSCKCGEISVAGGKDELKCYANDFSNFMRIGENEEEIAVTVVERDERTNNLTREEKIEMVSHMIDYYSNLPQSALLSAPTQYDLKAIYLLIKNLI